MGDFRHAIANVGSSFLKAGGVRLRDSTAQHQSKCSLSRHDDFCGGLGGGNIFSYSF